MFIVYREKHTHKKTFRPQSEWDEHDLHVDINNIIKKKYEFYLNNIIKIWWKNNLDFNNIIHKVLQKYSLQNGYTLFVWLFEHFWFFFLLQHSLLFFQHPYFILINKNNKQTNLSWIPLPKNFPWNVCPISLFPLKWWCENDICVP